MAKTFDPNRVRPGTIELVRAADGTYSTKVVGLETINSLSLPEISTTAVTTKTDTDTKTATDITGDTLQKQTQIAFETGGDSKIDTTANMLRQEAEKTSDMLSNTFSNARALMTSDEAYKGVTSPLKIKDPTEQFSTAKREMTQDEAYRQGIEDFKNYQDGILRGQIGTKAADRNLKGSAAVQMGEAEPPGIDFSFLGGERFKQGTTFTDASTRAAMTTDEAMGDNTKPSMLGDTGGTMDQMSGTLGITTAKPTETVTGIKGSPSEISGQQVEPEVKQPAVKTLSDSLNTLSEFSPLKMAGNVIGGVIKAITPEASPIQKLNTSYFNAREDGRIAGNPTKDLYAGFNRTSGFGNLEQAGKDRIATREKTIEKKGIKSPSNPNGVSQEFVDNTNKMKDQQKDYQKEKTATQLATQGPAGGATTGGGKSDTDSGKIVCTMMNESYGFGSFRNKIWMKFHGNIAPEYQKGYHKLFLPLVKYAKQKGIINKIIKNILEHIAVHSTIDMRQTLRGKKHILGRLYRKVILPLCYWAGKK